MRRGVLLVVLLTIVSTFGSPARATARRSAPADPTTTAAGAASTQRVIVTLRTPHRSEESLGRSGISEQRASIAAGTTAVDDLVGGLGGRVTRRFHSIPYVAVDATSAAIAALEQSPLVVDVVADTPIPLADAESTALVGATATHGAGVRGSGQAIAVLDTGMDGTHPFLAGKVIDEACFAATSTCPNGAASQLGAGAGAPCTFAASACRHGTHVAGIAAGGPAPGVSFTGIAPGAALVSVQVFSRFEDPICSALGQGESPCALTLNSDMLAGLEHVYDVASTLHVASVNMSIGGLVRTSACNGNVLKPAIDILRAIGVATVIAAGNDGRNGVAEPGCISSAISVGATTKSDTVASYSNSASFMTLWAPGSSIRSSVPGGGYANFNGTSMATPHVAGAFALARELYPTESVSQLVFRFLVAGPKITDTRFGVTRPRLDVLGATGAIKILPGTVTAAEGEELVIPATLTRASTLPVTAQYRTLSVQATDGVDFATQTGTITFAPGTTAAAVHIPGIQDAVPEPDEYMAVSFSAPQNAAMGGYWGLGFGLIVDDD
jgi:subtilisin